jgi:hypothetical protein
MGEERGCDKAVSVERFVSGAVGHGATWATAGFLFGETFGFGVSGGPGALAGLVFGEGINASSFAADYLSCKFNNKTATENSIQLFDSITGRGKLPPSAELPQLQLHD